MSLGALSDTVDGLRRGTLGSTSLSSSVSKDDIITSEVHILVMAEDPFVAGRLVGRGFVGAQASKYYQTLSRVLPREGGQDIHMRVSMSSGTNTFIGASDALYSLAHGVVYASERGQRPSEAYVESAHQALLRVAGVDYIPATIIELADHSDAEPDGAAGEEWKANVTKILDGGFSSASTSEEIAQLFSKFALDVNSFVQGASTRKKKDLSKLTEYKFLVLGDVFVGKTSIIERLSGKRFLDAQYKETKGEVTTQLRIQAPERELLLSLTEVPGLAASLSPEAINACQAVILAYSVASRQSLATARARLEEVLAGKGAARIPAVFVATKTDLGDVMEQVSEKEGKAMASKFSGSWAPFSFQGEMDEVIKGIDLVITDILSSQQAIGISIGEVTITGMLNLTDKKFKKFKQKVFSLRDGFVYYSNDGSVTPKTDNVSLNNYGVNSVMALPSDPSNHMFPFELRTPTQHLFLSACTEQEQRNWLESLCANVAANQIGYSFLDEVIEMTLSELIREFLLEGNSGDISKRSSRSIRSLRESKSNRSSTSLSLLRGSKKDKDKDKEKDKDKKKKKK
eukprot:TRINITY_DN2839_c0_g2_i3.p1 TRINITY_DN2839_c0_g2~~TRINITY_DN2839_c0_g2_i3.p1  ORF type:complete len:571 (-),score=192.44 TRINITY_DN2839_c0_g2_i3:103-1815(-)